MNCKKVLKPLVKRTEAEPSIRKRQYHAIDNLETEYFNIKDEKYEHENFDDYNEEYSENEEYLVEELDSGTGSIGQSLGNWARKNQMSHESFSELTKVLKRAGLNVPDNYSPSNKKINLNNMNAMMMSMHNQMIELRQQNTGILNKIKTLEMHVIKCNSTLENLLLEKAEKKTSESARSTNQLNYSLPINTIEDLHSLEEVLNDSTVFEDYVKNVRLLTSRNPRFSLESIFGKNIIFNYNWDGSQSKKALRDFKNINKALFEAWKGEEITHEYEYTSYMRIQFHQSKRRIHQLKYRLSKKMQE